MPSSVEFNRQIRPILADNCFLCHGPDKGTRKAGLRLDDRDAALRGVKNRPAIVPGQSASSELVRRITSTNPEEVMPQRESGKSLTAQQTALIKKWIDEGAKYEPHWAYLSAKKKSPPAVKNNSWVRNPVDAFILAELEKEGLAPSPEADRHTLIRRLSFDLIGLPPTPEEVDAFARDSSPDAYEGLVERLLASEHYGERMAVWWLDLVRFADTVGYHGDQNTDVFPYRDYVIRAFNQNHPFDRFTREQLAGDLFPNATVSQRVASAYNRLNMVTREGGAQAKEYLAKYAADRVRTTATVWLGATLGCAQCHDHKFDPFTTKDFYSFAAFFADVKEEGVYQSDGFYDSFPPVIRVPSSEQQRVLDELEEKLARAAKEKARVKEIGQRLQSSETSLADSQSLLASQLEIGQETLDKALTDWTGAARAKIAANDIKEVALVVEDDVRGGKKQESWRLVDKANGQPTHSGKRVREQAADGMVQHVAIGFQQPYKLQAAERLYAYVYLDPQKIPETLMLQWDSGGTKWQHRAFWGKDLIAFGKIGSDAPDHRHMGEIPTPGQWVRLEVELEKVGLKGGQELHGIAFTQHGGRAWWDTAGLLSNDLPPESIVAILVKDDATKTETDRKALLAYYWEERVVKAAEEKHASALKQRADFEKTLPFCVVTESVPPRWVRILPRGNWMDDSGEIVSPAVPQFLTRPTVEGDRRLTRLDLANWLVAPENPLTARVCVNRLWKLYFGTGLSKVLDDLGTRSEWPRHLDLLDWLALEFRDSGWDVKHMVKLLVTSSTYRQSSKPTDKLKEVDPYNRLHARQSRPRIDAEFVRDNALAISGLLVPTIGGRSAKPYQPSDYYKELNFPKRTYTPDKGENQYRRGLYTHWQRTFLHPSLSAFDAPPREECVAERTVSNSPLQALALLNDPTYVEAARVFAEHILQQGGAHFEERLRWAYRRALSRAPTEREVATLKALYDQQLVAFQADPAAAKQLAQVGYAPVPQPLEGPDLAAWTSVSRALLNLYETIVRY